MILHAPDAKRAQPSLAALKEHAVTVVHRGGDVERGGANSRNDRGHDHFVRRPPRAAAAHS